MALAWAICASENTRNFGKQNPNCRFFPSRLADTRLLQIRGLAEHLFRSVICQAVILTRWEHN
jgi:hypothetical protein